MRLLITGASSFVGAHFCLSAKKRHRVWGGFFSNPLSLPGITPIRVDLLAVRDQRKIRALEVDAVVHLATKIKATPKADETSAQRAYEINRKMMDAVLALQKPVLYGSSTAVHWSADIPYVRSRQEDEDALRRSGLPYAILRPSAPYGPDLISHRPRHKESFQTLVNVIRWSPVVPLVGSGNYMRQPVHVDDFSEVGLRLLESGLSGQELDVVGCKAYSMREIVSILSKHMHQRRRLVPIPKPIFVWLSRFRSDFDESLLEVIDEDEVFDASIVKELTGISPRSFEEGVSDLLR